MAVQLQVVLLFLLVPSALSECTINRDALFSCSPSDRSFLTTYYPDNWWGNGETFYVNPIEYVRRNLQCCLYCVWSLEYPATIPTVTLYGPTLDCEKFLTDFQTYDINSDERLTRSEFQAYLDRPLNSILISKQFLDPEVVFTSADLDRNKFISSGEFMVLRHFWAVAELTKSGPTAFSNDTSMGTIASGRLGGFLIDRGQLSLWFTQAFTLTQNFYSSHSSEGWDPQLVRDATTAEKNSVFSIMDLDSSGVISLEEHYFRYFADVDGDGSLTAAEYYNSLYRNVNDAGEQDNRFLYPINFNEHDWNRDGRVSFLERKFVAADLDGDDALTATEWSRGDFPGGFVTEGQEMTRIKYFYFTALLACTRDGGWSADCLLDVRFQNFAPFSTAELAPPGPLDKGGANISEAPTGSACEGDAQCGLGRACSYFGFCHEVWNLAPVGNYPRFRRWASPPAGLLVDTWTEVARRLGYNFTWTLLSQASLEDAQARLGGGHRV